MIFTFVCCNGDNDDDDDDDGDDDDDDDDMMMMGMMVMIDGDGDDDNDDFSPRVYSNVHMEYVKNYSSFYYQRKIYLEMYET